MRLKELSDQCKALGIDLVYHYVLVVLDADTGPLGPGARASVLRQVADAAQNTFRAGETIAATDSGRIIILGPRRRDLPGMVQNLLAEVQDQPQVGDHRVCGWIEPLPRDRVHHDALIDDLAR
jgi:GGDEF-like domain